MRYILAVGVILSVMFVLRFVCAWYYGIMLARAEENDGE